MPGFQTKAPVVTSISVMILDFSHPAIRSPLMKALDGSVETLGL